MPLDPKYAKPWDDTRTALLWGSPAFSHILYTMLDKVGSDTIAIFTPDVPIAATDGDSLILNPETFFQYKLMERVFIVAHEIMHCILGHMHKGYQFRRRGLVALPNGKDIPYDHQTMNAAMDYVVNAILIDSKTGTFNNDWLYDTKIATAQDSVIDIYAKLFKDGKGQKGGGTGSGSGQGSGSFDEHLNPGTSQGKDPTQATQDRNEAEWGTAIAAAAHAARVQGKLPAGLDRVLSEALDPKVDWREHIQALFARAIGSDTIDWRRAQRQYIIQDIYVPETAGFGAELVVVAIDTSGSIGQAELNMFFAELQGILDEVKPEEVHVVWCDAMVHRVDVLTDSSDLRALMMKKAPGGGGTDFRPVFEYVANQGKRVDALVYLTDGYGSFPDAPDYPVIWGDIAKNPNYPFGNVVEVPRG